MTTIKNSSNVSRTISYFQEIDRKKVLIHKTIIPGEVTEEIPDDIALNAMTTRNPDWIGVWVPGDNASQKLLDGTKPKIETVGGKKGSKIRK